jgi:hypothetical protein
MLFVNARAQCESDIASVLTVKYKKTTYDGVKNNSKAETEFRIYSYTVNQDF